MYSLIEKPDFAGWHGLIQVKESRQRLRLRAGLDPAQGIQR